MFKNMKLSAKMTLMGAGIALAMVILSVIVYRSNVKVKEELVNVQTRNEQNEAVMLSMEDLLNLNLGSMEAFFNRESGTISKEWLDSRKEEIANLTKSIEMVIKAADTPEEKEWAKGLRENAEKLFPVVTEKTRSAC